MKSDCFVLWLLGPTSSGKTTLAEYCVKEMCKQNHPCIHYDGDEIRDFFGSTLDFSEESRLRVVRTLVHLSNKTAKAGLNVVVSALTANEDARIYVKKNVNNLILGYVKCPIEICALRDPKGLYQKAFNKEIDTLIGVNRPYIEPDNPDIILYSGQSSLAAIYKQIIEYLNTARYLIKNDHSE